MRSRVVVTCYNATNVFVVLFALIRTHFANLRALSSRYNTSRNNAYIRGLTLCVFVSVCVCVCVCVSVCVCEGVCV